MSEEKETKTAVTESAFAEKGNPSLSEYVSAYWKRMRGGDLGSLPIVLGVVIIWAIFYSLNENYLTPRNFVNLLVQMAGITTIAIGVVYVLLLGEIDLSIGYVSAVAAVLMTLLLRPPGGWPWYAAIIAALAAVAVIGIVQGLIITRFQLPSFVVTLAGFLVWNGVVLILIGSGGTVIIQDSIVISIANHFFLPWQGWLIAAVGILIYAFTRFNRWRMRRARGVSTTPPAIIAVQIGILIIAAVAAVYFANLDRGVPFVGVLLLVLLIGFTFLAERTKFGRYSNQPIGHRGAGHKQPGPGHWRCGGLRFHAKWRLCRRERPN